MFHNHVGDVALEWIVVAAVAIAVLGGALYSVFQSISTKLNEINVQIGS